MEIAVTPRILKDVDLIIEADNYKKHVSTVKFGSQRQTQTWTGLAPDASFSETGTPTWSLELSYAQDWETAGSLSRYLHAHDGERVTVKFKPRSATGAPAFTSHVTLSAGDVGGTAGQYAVATVTLGCTKPVPDYDDNPATTNPDE